MRKALLASLTLLTTFVTESVIAPPVSAQTVAAMHPTPTIAVAPAAPTDVQAVPGDPAAGHYIVVSFTDNSDNEVGFEIWNGNDPSVGERAASVQGTSPSPGTGGTVTWNWWMPQANSYMCVRVRAYNNDFPNPSGYSAWAPTTNNGWACTTSS